MTLAKWKDIREYITREPIGGRASSAAAEALGTPTRRPHAGTVRVLPARCGPARCVRALRPDSLGHTCSATAGQRAAARTAPRPDPGTRAPSRQRGGPTQAAVDGAASSSSTSCFAFVGSRIVAFMSAADVADSRGEPSLPPLEAREAGL
jgi:hypothetical protein